MTNLMKATSADATPQNLIGDQDLLDVARAAVDEAKKGNMYGAEVARRLWRDRRRPVTLDLPAIDDARSVAAAQGAVIAAASSGKIATRDALDFATMLEYRRRSIETVEDREAGGSTPPLGTVSAGRTYASGCRVASQ